MLFRSDSAALAAVAGAAADFAPVACATLRYFYPACACGSKAAGGIAAAQRTLTVAAAPPLRPAPVRTYPNPAHETVSVEAAGLPQPATRCQLVAAATGQVVLTQALSGGRATLAVAALAPGLYLGRLLDAAGQTVGTCKIVVIH